MGVGVFSVGSDEGFEMVGFDDDDDDDDDDDENRGRYRRCLIFICFYNLAV